MSKYCTYCGKEIGDRVKFCPFCGKASHRTVPSKQGQTSRTVPPEQGQAKQTAQPKQEQTERTASPEQGQAERTAPPKQAQANRTAPPEQGQAERTAPPEQGQAKQTAQPKQGQAKQTAQPKQEQARRTATHEQEQAREPSPQAQPAGRGASRTDERSLSAKDLAARYCGNWMALVFTILLTLNIIFNIIDAVNALIVSDYLSGAFNLLFLIGDIICCIGCWIAYSDAACHHTRASGLTVIGAGLLVPLILCSVFFGLICLVLIIYLVFMIGAAGELGSLSILSTDLASSTLTTIMIIFAIVVLIGVLTICTYVGLRHTTASGVAVLSGRRGKWDISMFALVILIILAVLNFLELLFTLILVGAVNSTGSLGLEIVSALVLDTDVFSILSDVLDLAVYVFAIIILFRIRHAFALRNPAASASDGR